MMPTHDTGRLDRRYSVTIEFTGAARPQFVARFCGDWIGSAAIRIDAETLACDHADARRADIEKPLGSVRRMPASVRALSADRPHIF